MSDLMERIDAAIKRITIERRPPLSIPLHDSDVDVVLSDAKAEIEQLRKRVNEQEEFIDRLTCEPQSQDCELEDS